MTWDAPTAEQRVTRNEKIRELWELGVSREEIARITDLSPQRISQIVNAFGETFRRYV